MKIAIWPQFDNSRIDEKRGYLWQDLSVGNNFLTFWPWPWLLTYFWKNLTLTITFEPKVIGLWYYTYLFPVTRPFFWYQYFWPSGLDLDFDLILEKLELVDVGGTSPVRTDPDLVLTRIIVRAFMPPMFYHCD